MVGKPDLIFMALLRRIDDQLSEARLDLAEMKDRMGLSDLQWASVSRRVDRIGSDTSKIKMRLDITEGEA